MPEIWIPIRDILMWGVWGDLGAVSIKLAESQTGSQTLVGKRQNIKFSAETEILFQSNSSLSRSPPVAGARLKIPSKMILSPKKGLNIANWSDCCFSPAPLATLLPSTWLPQSPHSLSTHPPLPGNGAVSASCACLLPAPPEPRGGEESHSCAYTFIKPGLVQIHAFKLF